MIPARAHRLAAGALAAALLVPPAAADDLGEVSGQVAAAGRVFAEPGALAKQERADGSLVARLRYEIDWDDGEQRFSAEPFLRLDQHDGRRSHFDLREAVWRRYGDAWDLRAGVDKVFWGVAESRHLVDIVNQTDLVEDPDEEDKLGQPMASVGFELGPGYGEAFLLPRFRERTFPGGAGRLRSEPRVEDEASYQSGLGAWHPDLALRWSGAVEAYDIGLSYFRGTSHEPGFVPGPSGGLTPRYALIDQGGIDLQATFDAWLLKFEGIGRIGGGDAFGATVAGFEYTVFGAFGTAADIGVLAEHLYDGRDAPRYDDPVPPTLFQQDLFLGLRYAANDVMGTEVLAGVVKDLEGPEFLVSVEASRRIGEAWRATAELRAFRNIASATGLAYYNRDSYLQLGLEYHF